MSAQTAIDELRARFDALKSSSSTKSASQHSDCCGGSERIACSAVDGSANSMHTPQEHNQQDSRVRASSLSETECSQSSSPTPALYEDLIQKLQQLPDVDPIWGQLFEAVSQESHGDVALRPQAVPQQTSGKCSPQSSPYPSLDKLPPHIPEVSVPLVKARASCPTSKHSGQYTSPQPYSFVFSASSSSNYATEPNAEAAASNDASQSCDCTKQPAQAVHSDLAVMNAQYVARQPADDDDLRSPTRPPHRKQMTRAELEAAIASNEAVLKKVSAILSGTDPRTERRKAEIRLRRAQEAEERERKNCCCIFSVH